MTRVSILHNLFISVNINIHIPLPFVIKIPWFKKVVQSHYSMWTLLYINENNVWWLWSNWGTVVIHQNERNVSYRTNRWWIETQNAKSVSSVYKVWLFALSVGCEGDLFKSTKVMLALPKIIVKTTDDYENIIQQSQDTVIYILFLLLLFSRN